MSHPAPKVYIDDLLMDDFALSDHPVLAGLEIEFGTDNDLDMQGVETCSLQMLIREPEDIDFLDIGKTVAVVHDGASPFTYFVGRIQRLWAEPHPDKKGALLVTISCADLTADLVNEVVYNINAAATTAQTRLANLNYWAPAGWSISTFGLLYPGNMSQTMIYKEKPFLELVDQLLRGQLMRRVNRSWYKPGTGIMRTLFATPDYSRSANADKLGLYPDGTWGVIPGAPSDPGAVTVLVRASNVLADAGWGKEPEDVITEVSVQRLDESDGLQETTTTPITSRLYVDTSAMRARYGIRSVEFDTDLQAGGAIADPIAIFNHWLTTDSKWRTKRVQIKDSDRLTLDQIAYLIAPTSRQTAFLVIRQPMRNRPDHAAADIRGTVIGGSATWNGKKWELSLTLGRVPPLPAAGDYYTCELISTTAGGYFAAGACNTVGDELSCNDFLRIGAP